VAWLGQACPVRCGGQVEVEVGEVDEVEGRQRLTSLASICWGGDVGDGGDGRGAVEGSGREGKA